MNDRPHSSIDLEPLPLRRILDLAVEPLRHSFRLLVWRLIVPLMTILTAFSLLYLRAMQQFFEVSLRGSADVENLFASSANIFILALAAFVLYLLVYGILTSIALDLLAGRAPDLGRAGARILRPRALWTMALIAAISGMSALFCLLPALVVMPLLVFTLPAMIAEGKSGLGAVERSVELARFNPRGGLARSPWLKIVAAVAATWGISQGLALAFQWPLLVVQQILISRQIVQGADPLAFGGGLLWLQVPMGLLGSFASIVGWLYGSLVLVMLFDELRRRREGRDLERAIAGLATPGESTAADPAADLADTAEGTV